MSSDGAVAPVGPSHQNSMIDYGRINSPLEGFRQAGREFGEGFQAGSEFSWALMGAGVNAVTNLGKGQIKGNFG